MAVHKTLRVILPADWYEVAGSAPREFRCEVEGAGVLQIALHPPQPSLREDSGRVMPWLQAFIRNEMPEASAVVHESNIDCAAGPCAFSLRRSDRCGMIGIWVIASEV
jgi:hypothetical protein